MEKIIQMLEVCLVNKQDCVLATIVEQKGSTPRGAGASMLVGKEGRLAGTVGGGAIEYKCECLAKELIDLKASRLEQFYLKPNEIQDLGMVCGGDVTIYFQFIEADQKENQAIVNQWKQLSIKDEQCWMIQDITSHTWSVFSKTEGVVGQEVPSCILETLKEKPYQIHSEGHHYFTLPLRMKSRVFVFGGGHVSQALVPILSTVGFQCTVLEDREAFCNRELFPTAEQVMQIDVSKISEYIHIKEQDFVCIMTRGHKDDLEVQAQVLHTPAAYIGVIGSRRKKASVFEKLRERGFTKRDLQRITTPIGVDIKAETPAEIAISITAQMIEKRAILRNQS